jgi:hypothetical protein
VVRASGSYPLCQGFESLHRHLSIRRPAVLAALAAAVLACQGAADETDSPEEEVELARAKAGAGELLQGFLIAKDASLSVRLRAIRGLVESGRIDLLRRGLRLLPADQARVLVEQSVSNLTWLTMAGAVPDRRLRRPQVFAKDALLLLDEWMSPEVRRDARAVVVRWFLQDLPGRAGEGEVPLGRADGAVRTSVLASATLRNARSWSEIDAIAALALSAGTPTDRQRLRDEAAEMFVRAPYATPEARAEVRSGVLAALRGLSGDGAALKAGQAGKPLLAADNRVLADLASMRDALAALVRTASEPEELRLGAVTKLRELAFPLRPLGLSPVVADEAVPAPVRAALAAGLVEEGDAESSAAAVLAREPEVFAAVAGRLRQVKIVGQILPFARLVGAGADRLLSLPGRCDALVDALAAMGPRRAATAASLLLGSEDPFIMSLAVEVFARVGTSERASELEAHRGSKARTACWSDRTVGDQVARALAAIASRGGAGGATEAGDEDGG